MKKYPALLWGIAVMVSVESRSTALYPPITNINNSSTTTQIMKREETASSQITPAPHHETDQQPHTGHPEYAVTPSNNTISTQSPAETRAPTTTTAAAPEHPVSHSGKSEEATSRTQSPSPDSRGSTADGGIRSTSAGTVTSSSPHPTLTTVTGAAQASHTANVSETEKPIEHTSGQQTATTSSDLSTMTTATGLYTPSQGRSAFTTAITSAPSSTSHNSTPSQSFTQGLSSTVASSTPTNAATKSTSVFDTSTTSGPATMHQSSTAFTQHQSASQPSSTKNAPISPSNLSNTTTPGSTTDSTTELRATTEAASTISESISTTGTSNHSSAGGVLIPKVPTRSPSTTTTVPRKESGRDSVVSKCLIAIAALAGLATIFMVSTIILCTKLSSRKYRCRRDSQEGTEMVCISALMPERSFSYAPRYNPVSNGFLLPNAEGDSDEDGGDNLTLRSFLPESDHV